MTDQEKEKTSGSGVARKGQPLSTVLDRNINALIQRRAADQKTMSRQERIAEAMTNFAGSMPFVYLHALVFGLWIVVNVGWLPVMPAFDPSLVILAMVASVEAIFISTFVLISQNRMALEDDKRADLSLQISLLNEHETTKLIAMVSAIADRLGIETEVERHEIEEMKQNVPPEVVMEEIERQADR
ncbi:DUF1003 domain-containing protein [Neorhizobium galegae]|uniref:DUF1003 domain-containing protein n=1 Tax=Neorhizobium galegae bv. officinalis TaxID=323656 RepID=A0A0T7GS16_NEOGA|nr:DUF1003 domain-containing protein [Neorhizobium galegae]CDZ50074.1 Hypothetical protein NGAL_HAMBI1189_32710 [Neorhizobium galegae bv. officinalis]